MVRKIIVALIVLSILGCGDELKKSDKKGRGEIQKQVPSHEIKYHLIPVNEQSKAWINVIKSDDSLKVILFLNRVDKRYIFWPDSLVLPDTFVKDIMAYAPFPTQMEILKAVPKIIYFSYYAEAFAVYENGKLIRWGPVSMGSFYTQTPTGLYHTNWKAPLAISQEHRDWLMHWFFNLDNYNGISMHEYDMPGFPASHACIRLHDADAKWLYTWAEKWICSTNTKIDAYGTPVIIYGSYPYGKRKPWKHLVDNNNALNISEDSLTKITNKYLPTIIQRQHVRDSVLQKMKDSL